jgi:hypothetical protein
MIDYHWRPLPAVDCGPATTAMHTPAPSIAVQDANLPLTGAPELEYRPLGDCNPPSYYISSVDAVRQA